MIERAGVAALAALVGSGACASVRADDPLVHEARPAIEAIAQLVELYELLGADPDQVGRCRSDLAAAAGALDAGAVDLARQALGQGLACTRDVGDAVTDRVERLRSEGGPDPLALLGREVDLGDGFHTLVGVRVREREGTTTYELNLRSSSGLHETRTLKLR